MAIKGQLLGDFGRATMIKRIKENILMTNKVQMYLASTSQTEGKKFYLRSMPVFSLLGSHKQTILFISKQCTMLSGPPEVIGLKLGTVSFFDSSQILINMNYIQK